MHPAALVHSARPYAALATWLPLLVGILALFGPTFYDLSTTVWRSEEQAHAPIILTIVAWILWQKRGVLAAMPIAEKAGSAAWVLLTVGSVLYVVGRSQSIIIFEVGSLIPILAGVLATVGGYSAVRTAAFPILFLSFMLPVPGPVVDALTGPLKQFVSVIAENGLHALGYPIARSGIVLSIGQYQLLVADACSGLNSMFSLGALGVLYLHFMRYSSRWRNAVIVVSIVPIAFITNVIRVMVLVLVTHHFGEGAGQGVIHGAAGMMLFGIALILFLSLDGVLGLHGRRKAESEST